MIVVVGRAVIVVIIQQCSNNARIFLYMVVVNLMKIILVDHLLQILLHTLLTQVVGRIRPLVVRNYLSVLETHIGELVAESQPSRHAVIGTTE